MDLVAQVVEGEDAVEKHEHAVGDVEVVFCLLSDVFEAADNVVGAITDGSGGEGRQAFHGGGTMLLEEFLDDGKNVAGAFLDLAAALDGDAGAARFEAQKGAHAEEGVAANFFSTFDGLEEKGVGLSFGHGEKGRDGREQVSGDGLGHRNQRGGARQAQKLFVVGTDHVVQGFIIRKRVAGVSEPQCLATPVMRQVARMDAPSTGARTAREHLAV
jgi:hypothetical protein